MAASLPGGATRPARGRCRHEARFPRCPAAPLRAHLICDSCFATNRLAERRLATALYLADRSIRSRSYGQAASARRKRSTDPRTGRTGQVASRAERRLQPRRDRMKWATTAQGSPMWNANGTSAAWFALTPTKPLIEQRLDPHLPRLRQPRRCQGRARRIQPDVQVRVRRRLGRFTDQLGSPRLADQPRTRARGALSALRAPVVATALRRLYRPHPRARVALHRGCGSAWCVRQRPRTHRRYRYRRAALREE